MGADFPNRASANWGPIQTPNQQAAQQNAVNSVDAKQKPLVRAIASLIQAASADLYASNEDRKYRYIVDLILDRVRAALNKQLSDLSDTQLEAISKQNESLLKAISTSTSGIVESAFSKLDVTLDKKQADGILDQFNGKLDAAVASLKDQIEKGWFSTSSSKKTSSEEDAATKADQRETIRSIDALKKQLAKQFSADRSSNNAPAISSGKKAFKAASALVISKQLSALAKNQKIINQSMTKRFEKTTKTISRGVDRLHDTTSTNFYNLNDKLEDSMAKLGRQTKRISAGIVAGVVGAIAAITVGIKKTFGAVFTGLKAISGGLFRLFKKPAGVIGDLLKNLIATPGGMFAIGWIGGYIYQKWLKPLWDWMEPIRITLGQWFGSKITFEDACKKIGNHLLSRLLTAWEGLKGIWENAKEPIKDFLASYFGYDKKQTFWQNISNGIKILWSGEDSKGGLKGMLIKAWNLDINPTLRNFFGVPDGKTWIDWFLNIKITSIPIWGDITIKNMLVGLAGYLALNAGAKVIDITHKFGQAVQTVIGFGKTVAGFGNSIVNGIKNFGNPARKAADLAQKSKDAAKMAAEAQKLGRAKDAIKFQKQAADYAKRTRDLAAKYKGTRNATAIANNAREATLAQGRATRSANLANRKPPGSAPKPLGKGLKVAAKTAGAALVVADAAGNAVSAYDAFKNGDIAEGISQSGFATAKVATLAAGPLAPVAYGAIMATEMINDAIKASTAEIEGAVDDMNQRTEEVFKTKVLGAIREQGKRESIDKLLGKMKNFDKTKAEVDPISEKMAKLQAQLDKMNGSNFSKIFSGAKIRELSNQIDELNMQRLEILGKSGLNLDEISKSKDRLLDSRSSRDILRTMTPEMQARLKQIMAEQTKIGPDNLKILPDMQKVLEQLKQEYEGGGLVTEKVDQVGDNVEQMKQLQQQQLEQQRQMFEYMKQHPNGQPLTIVNAPQVQAQERSFTTMDK